MYRVIREGHGVVDVLALGDGRLRVDHGELRLVFDHGRPHQRNGARGLERILHRPQVLGCRIDGGRHVAVI